MSTLIEERLFNLASATGVTPHNWNRLIEAIAPLKTHSYTTYLHSLRVGYYSAQIALAMDMDPKYALHGGCTHDVGKCAVHQDVIHSAIWGPNFKTAMEVHPQAGFDMLKESHLFSSFVAGLHHSFQENPYGVDMREFPAWLGSGKLLFIKNMASLVATADVWDAMTTRPPLYTKAHAWDMMAQQGFSSLYVDILYYQYDWLLKIEDAFIEPED